MDKDTLQQLIEHCDDPNTMITIAEAYIDGIILRDPLAAEAWLMRAINTENPLAAPKAMGILAVKLLGKTTVLSEADYLDIRHRLNTACNAEQDELLALLKLATDAQKRL